VRVVVWVLDDVSLRLAVELCVRVEVGQRVSLVVSGCVGERVCV